MGTSAQRSPKSAQPRDRVAHQPHLGELPAPQASSGADVLKALPYVAAKWPPEGGSLTARMTVAERTREQAGIGSAGM